MGDNIKVTYGFIQMVLSLLQQIEELDINMNKAGVVFMSYKEKLFFLQTIKDVRNEVQKYIGELRSTLDQIEKDFQSPEKSFFDVETQSMKIREEAQEEYNERQKVVYETEIEIDGSLLQDVQSITIKNVDLIPMSVLSLADRIGRKEFGA